MTANKVYVEGDSLIIEATAPLVGVLSLIDYTDSVTNSLLTSKYYRVSVNGGISFTEWKPLDKETLEQEQISPDKFFLIQYKYTKTSDSTTEVSFKDISLFVEKMNVSCPTEYNNSLFNQFFSCDSPDVLLWCVNVTQKAWSLNGGIVSKYLKRNDEFLAFWGTVACFFSMCVNYGRRFLYFANEPQLLSRYVEEMGFSICNTNDIEKLLYHMNNAFAIIEKRGTVSFLEEYKEMICYNSAIDDFIFSPSLTGWFLNNTSPIYRNTRKNVEKDFVSEIFNKFDSSLSYLINFDTQQEGTVSIEFEAKTKDGAISNLYDCGTLDLNNSLDQ